MTDVQQVARTTVRHKGQVTLPDRIRRAAGLQEGQVFEVTYDQERDLITLRPVAVVPRPR